MRTGFGQFVLDSETRQLLRGGEEIHLSPKAFDLLCTLVARRPSVVSKADLFGQIWPNTFVVEGNLNVLVSEIRKALDEDAQSPQFIRTAHGVGYAFCAETTDLSGAAHHHEEPKTRCWLVWKDRTFLLTAGDNVIGRDPGCNVWLDHSGVSRRHARIRIADEIKSAVLEDLKSTNGTFVGREQVKAQTALADGDVIKVGSIKLTFRSWSDEPSRTKRIRRSGWPPSLKLRRSRSRTLRTVRTLAAMFCGAGRRRHAARAPDGQMHRRLATPGWGWGSPTRVHEINDPEVHLPGVPTGTRAECRCRRANR